MAIPNKKPLTIPASESQTFDAIWLTDIRILSPGLSQGSIRIKHQPFDSLTGGIGHKDHTRIIQTGELWLASSEVPEVAAAMQAVFAAVPALEAWLDSKNPPDEGDPE